MRCFLDALNKKVAFCDVSFWVKLRLRCRGPSKLLRVLPPKFSRKKWVNFQNKLNRLGETAVLLNPGFYPQKFFVKNASIFGNSQIASAKRTFCFTPNFFPNVLIVERVTIFRNSHIASAKLPFRLTLSKAGAKAKVEAEATANAKNSDGLSSRLWLRQQNSIWSKS